MEINRENIAEFVFLEIASISPLIILLGNIVPPFPIKLHFIGFGLLMISALWVIINNGHKKWMLYIALFYVLIQGTLYDFAWKDLIDFFFGPFVLLVFIDLVANKKLTNRWLFHYQKRFYYFMWIPIVIGVLQFFEILPITFWNATYINYAKFADGNIPRPNGFLYHGSELCILITFAALYQFFKREREAFWMLLLIIAIGITTYFKAVLVCLILIFVFYVSFINRGVLSRFRILSKKSIIAYSALAIITASVFVLQYFSMMQHYTGYYFHQQLLTGRGAIWNIYLDGIADFNLWNWMFGGGMGSSYQIFRDNAFADNFYPLTQRKELESVYDSHNGPLSVFINAGLFGIMLIGFLFKLMYTQIKKWKPDGKWNKTVFIGAFFIPLFTIGITIPIYDMAIFWVCLGFFFVRWADHHNKVSNELVE